MLVWCSGNWQIKEELGWNPKFTDLQQSLATAWQWIKAHPDGYEADYQGVPPLDHMISA